MIKIEPKMLSLAKVLVLRWKICDTCEKSLWVQRGREELCKAQTRGDCSIALKFESSESVHESSAVTGSCAIQEVSKRKALSEVHEPIIPAIFAP
jgi:hypothetical protein